MIARVSSATCKTLGHRASARCGVVAMDILVNTILEFSETDLSFGAQWTNFD